MEDVITQLAKKIYMGIFQRVLVVLFQPLDKEGFLSFVSHFKSKDNNWAYDMF